MEPSLKTGPFSFISKNIIRLLRYKSSCKILDKELFLHYFKYTQLYISSGFCMHLFDFYRKIRHPVVNTEPRCNVDVTDKTRYFYI